MDSILSAWGTYIVACGIIYSIGQKAGDVLSKEALRDITTFSKDHPVTRIVERLVSLVASVVDRALRFRRDGAFLIPSFQRSLVFSFVMLVLISYPLRDFFVFNLTFMPGAVPLFPILKQALTEPSVLLDPVLLIPMFSLIVSNTIADYLSFAKTRSLIERFRTGSLYRVVVFAGVDIILSVMISLFVALTTALFIMDAAIFERDRAAWLPPSMLITIVASGVAAVRVRSWSIVVTVVVGLAVLLAGTLVSLATQFGFVEALGASKFSLVSTVTVPVLALATSLGIALLSILAVLVQTVAWGIGRLENRNIWRFLNFDDRPAQASAVVLIAIFTVLFWPSVLLFR